MIFHLVQILVVGGKFCEIFVFAEGIQIRKDRISFYLTRVRYLQMVRIRVHGHDLLTDFLFWIGKIDTVSQRFTHLRLAIDTRQAQAGLIIRQQHIGLDQGITIDRIKLTDNLPSLFQHRQLILAHRNRCRLKCGDIRRLTDRICEESDGNAGFKVAHLDFRFHCRISLQTRDRDQIHIIEREFTQFRNLRLDEQRRLRRIQTASQVV